MSIHSSVDSGWFSTDISVDFEEFEYQVLIWCALLGYEKTSVALPTENISNFIVCISLHYETLGLNLKGNIVKKHTEFRPSVCFLIIERQRETNSLKSQTINLEKELEEQKRSCTSLQGKLFDRSNVIKTLSSDKVSLNSQLQCVMKELKTAQGLLNTKTQSLHDLEIRFNSVQVSN